MGDRRIWLVIAAGAALFVAAVVGKGLLREGEVQATGDEVVEPLTESTPSQHRAQARTRTQQRSSSSLSPPERGAGAADGDSLDFEDAPFPEADEERARAERVGAALAADEGHVWTTDAEGIQSAIFESLGEIRECYDGWLALQPDLQGEIVVRFVITEDEGVGVVSEAEVVDGTLPQHTLFDGCVLNVMSDLQFEAPADGGEVEVNYPFAFSAG